MKDRSLVILVHGLWMNRYVMAGLALFLKRHGLASASVGYPSSRHVLDANADRIAQFIRRKKEAATAIVAHSYGGVVALRALERHADLGIRRVVLLGSPIAGSNAGTQLAQHRLGKVFLGETHSLWTMPRVTIPRGIEIGAIAGTVPFGFGRFVVRLAPPHDGVVCVEETRGVALADHLMMPVSHSAMLLSARVAAQADHFLRHGRFQR